MTTHPSGSGGAGLERSCAENASDWVRQTDVVGGVELFEAQLQHLNYRRHRHDTYAISLTESGVLTFGFRGATHVSLPGQVVVLHPDELHDGRAGADAGFGYRQLYVEPAALFPAIQAFGSTGALPFVRQPVITSPILAAVIQAAFDHDREPLAIDDVLARVAAGLLAADPGGLGTRSPRRLDVVAIDRVRQFLDAETARVVHSRELEAITRLD